MELEGIIADVRADSAVHAIDNSVHRDEPTVAMARGFLAFKFVEFDLDLPDSRLG